MGVWDAISSGEMPSWDDVGETASAAGDALYEGGSAVASGADTVMRYTNPLYAGLSYMHFEHRDQLNHVGDPSQQPSVDELQGDESIQNENGWTRLPHDLSILHQDETRPGDEAKFVNEDGRESVRYVDEDGNLQEEVTRDDIRGTYNYVNPGNWEEDNIFEYGARMIGHGVLDVLPWAIGGSVRGDG